jgi:hypothetical protein
VIYETANVAAVHVEANDLVELILVTGIASPVIGSDTTLAVVIPIVPFPLPYTDLARRTFV